MRVFLRVAEAGGFTAAARKLELDPPTVTRLVADLERHLGCPLLQRTTRRVSLTPAGEEYLARIRTILAEIDEADAFVRGQATALRGTLRVLALPAIASNMLAPTLKDFAARYPEIQVDIRTTDGAAPALEDHDLTFVGAYTPLPTSVVTREITAAVLSLFAAPEYLDRHGVPQEPQELARHRMLRLRISGETPGQLHLTDPNSADREEIVEIAPALVCDGGETVLRATLDGLGISSLSQAVAAPYVTSGALRPVLGAWITNRVRVLAAYPGRKSLARRARVFLDHILASVAPPTFAQMLRAEAALTSAASRSPRSGR